MARVVVGKEAQEGRRAGRAWGSAPKERCGQGRGPRSSVLGQLCVASSAGRGSLAVETQEGNPCSSDRSAYATNRRPRRDGLAFSEKKHTRGRDRARDRRANRGGVVIAGAVIKII